MRGIVHIDDEVYITDRNNESRTPVDRVTLAPTWDIDRSGSKGQVSVTADAGVLDAGMWLSTYRTITPEQGEIIRFPRGHWHLSRPGIAYPGGHEMDSGSVAVMQTASGSDIVDDIAGVILTEAFYTPVGGNILRDVKVLAKMATAGIIGHNLLANGGFESEGNNWGSGVIFEGSTTGSANWVPYNHSPAEGVRSFSPQININPQINTTVYVSQLVEIPPGTQMMYCSGLSRKTIGMHGMQLRMGFRDAANTNYGDVYSWIGADPTMVNQWYRHFMVAPVPTGATHVRVYPIIQITESGYAFGSRSSWDDIRVGTCTIMPLPDSRFNLPESSATATTRIQTDEGKNIAYDAINADRLNAISFNAIATDLEGRLTTQSSRTLENATARYTFGPDDIELLDMVTPEISAINELPFNHWHAVKEDFQDAANSISADSYNNNANDPFSVANSGSVRSAPVITVQDAVDQSALQAVADAARDRYSLSETVRFAIMPMADIDVYDVVEIADPDMPEINGKWALNSIDASGDYLVITATRAVSREV